MQRPSFQYDKILTSRRVRAALVIAIAMDVVQWVLLPLTLGGAASPANDALDVFVAALMVGMLGWHWPFLPTFVAKLVPFVDLAPTWTLAVWLVVRGRRTAAAQST